MKNLNNKAIVTVVEVTSSSVERWLDVFCSDFKKSLYAVALQIVSKEGGVLTAGQKRLIANVVLSGGRFNYTSRNKEVSVWNIDHDFFIEVKEGGELKYFYLDDGDWHHYHQDEEDKLSPTHLTLDEEEYKLWRQACRHHSFVWRAEPVGTCLGDLLPSL